jgi:hypothetical protein
MYAFPSSSQHSEVSYPGKSKCTGSLHAFAWMSVVEKITFVQRE